jgi:starvation-inducible outer membrane lipoprotein
LNYTYELKADGEKLTGKATRERDGETTEIELKEGKVSTNEVSFVEPLIFDDQEIRIEYKGKLAGDEIKFTRKVGDFATTEIIAKRVKAPSIAGKWQAEFDTEIGKQKYVYDFKVDGEKLTGRAIGDIAGEKSDTEIKDGRIVGSEVSFVEMVDFQGQQVRVAYKGKLANDELKLTRQVEDVATEELLAKRVKADEAK